MKTNEIWISKTNSEKVMIEEIRNDIVSYTEFYDDSIFDNQEEAMIPILHLWRDEFLNIYKRSNT